MTSTKRRSGSAAARADRATQHPRHDPQRDAPPDAPGAEPAVRWVEDVDFWVAQAIHAGADRHDQPSRQRRGKSASAHAPHDHVPQDDDDAADDGGDAPDLPGATLSEFDGVRYLHLGDTPWVQGAMRLRKPDVLELDYVQRLCAWLLWRAPEPGLRAVQLGLGAAALTRYCHGPLGLTTTAVEINSQVVAACRHWFKLPADGERLQVITTDAGAWIAAPERAGSIDVLNVDLYDHQAAAPVLDDAEFYAACQRALAPGGFMTVNLFGRKASFARSAERIAAAFGAPHCAMLNPTTEGNTIVIARQAEPGSPPLSGVNEADAAGRAALVERAVTIAQAQGLPAARWLKLLRPLIGPNGKASPLKPAAAKKTTTKANRPATSATADTTTTTTRSSRKANA